MKKITLIASAALLIGATSCNNKQNFTSTSTYKLESYSLVIGPDQDAAVTLTNYTFITDNYNYNLKMTSDDLVIGGNKVDFGTTEMPMVYGIIRMSGAKSQTSFYLSEAVNATPAGATPITNVYADFTTCSNTFNDSIVQDVLGAQLKLNPIVYPRTRIYSETQFKIGEYQVKTFWKDMIFTGTTNVVTADMAQVQKSQVPSYRVLMNLDKPGAYTADVFLYNVSYLETENPVNYVIKNVPVKFGSAGFVLECSEVTPEAITVKEGEKVPAIKVKRLQLNSSSQDLTRAECRIMLDNGYTVTFNGLCMLGFNMSDMKDK